MIITINEDLSSHVLHDDGVKFFNLPNYNPETLSPFGSETDVQNFIATHVTENYFVTPLSLEERQTTLIGNSTSRVQQRLDDFVKARGYDSMLSAATYATSKIPRFATEGQRAVDLRDETWAKLYEIMEDVKTDKRPMPESFEDIESELPALMWEIEK